ncbi:MAG: hypothetical protein L0H41_17845 [Microlunatus sp.]|uniref:hypothetical protein n=1 Tax=Intrasporangium sp. TaxID=1925024 RepID=UPI0026474741|nr:hypothetical protein [Intrasporangium sp.]MDN5764156.1 hypothetical protein [Microlunatus sp.]MDN5798168.1 hypothetical protein [Intrasporangium sp.]
MKTKTFRQHDQRPEWVASAIYRQLLQEWVDLNALTSSATTVRRWGRLEAALAGLVRPGDVVDAIDAAAAAQTDAMLLALIRLFQKGHQLAGRVVLQTMLPKLIRITLRTSPTSTDNAWTEDRHHITIAEFWDVLATYPIERRPAKVASNLALDTLHRVSGARKHEEAIPVDPAEMPLEDRAAYTFDHAASVGELSADSDLLQVITWGVAHQAISAEEGSLLAAAYPPSPGNSGFAAAAAERRLSQAAVRQRCSRASRRLTEAVRTELWGQSTAATA